MCRPRSRFWAISALALYASLISVSWGRASERIVEFDIPSQPLDSALLAFSEQANVQVSVSTVVIAGMRTAGVVGKFTPPVALTRLLFDTGLRFSTVGDRTYALAPEQAQTPHDTGASQSKGPMLIAAPPTSDSAQSPGVNGGPGEADRHSDSPSENNGVVLGEMAVTGSHIRGVTTVGAPLIRIDRDAIDRAGYSTTQEVVGSLPQNFGGGASTDKNGLDGSAGPSGGFGSGVNLRGLGNDSTLVLLNGRRLAPSGGGAEFVDVSLIPLSAVERIEVLTDGASALYGSDAVAGVVNFIMRSDYHGGETGVRLGSASGGENEELQFSQLLGKSWNDGYVLFAYEYHQQDNFASESRDFAADSDLTRFGGNNFSVSQSNPGNILDPLTGAPAFAIPSGQDGTALTPADLLPGVVNLQNTRIGTDLLPERDQHNVLATASQALSDAISVFGDVRYSKREFENRYNADTTAVPIVVPSTNPFFVDPFGGSSSISMNYSFVDDLGPQIEKGEAESYGGSIGTDFHVAGSWRAQGYGSYSAWNTTDRFTNLVNTTALDAALSDTNPATAFNPFGDGSNTNPATLEAILGFDLHDAESELWMLHFKADGSLFILPGGAAKLAVGTEYREESYERANLGFRSGTEPAVGAFNEGDRAVLAGFAEFQFPFVSRLNGRSGMRALELSAAVRYEDYSDFGSTADPRIGLVWSPIDGLAFRGTAGTSFKAPLLSQLEETTTLVFQFPFPDPSSPTGATNSIAVFGQKGGLQPEETTAWTAGVQFRPQGTANRVFEVNYFNIEVEDRIREPVSNPFVVFLDADIYAPIIERDPSAATVDSWRANPRFFCCALPPGEEVEAIVDARRANVAVTEIRGLDLLASYDFPIAGGAFEVQLNGTYLLDFKQGITATAPLLEQVSTLLSPSDLKLRSSLSWSRGAFSATTAINYIDDYVDPNPFFGGPIDSWTTVDLQLAFNAGDRFGIDLLSNVRAALNIQNLLDEDPPFANIFTGIGYDAVNSDPVGRFASLQISKHW